MPLSRSKFKEKVSELQTLIDQFESTTKKLRDVRKIAVVDSSLNEGELPEITIFTEEEAKLLSEIEKTFEPLKSETLHNKQQTTKLIIIEEKFSTEINQILSLRNKALDRALEETTTPILSSIEKRTEMIEESGKTASLKTTELENELTELKERLEGYLEKQGGDAFDEHSRFMIEDKINKTIALLEIKAEELKTSFKKDAKAHERYFTELKEKISDITHPFGEPTIWPEAWVKLHEKSKGFLTEYKSLLISFSSHTKNTNKLLKELKAIKERLDSSRESRELIQEKVDIEHNANKNLSDIRRRYQTLDKKFDDIKKEAHQHINGILKEGLDRVLQSDVEYNIGLFYKESGELKDKISLYQKELDKLTIMDESGDSLDKKVAPYHNRAKKRAKELERYLLQAKEDADRLEEKIQELNYQIEIAERAQTFVTTARDIEEQIHTETTSLLLRSELF